MYKITNVTLLGTEYSVADPSGKIIKNIQVIPHSDILSASLGKYDPTMGSVQTYLEKSIGLLCGFSETDTHRTMWYATEQEEVVLSEIIEFAVMHDYDRIILEYIDPAE